MTGSPIRFPVSPAAKRLRTIPVVMPVSRSLVVPLLAFASLGLAAALLLAGLNSVTEERIESQRHEHALRAVSSMLDAVGYDNDLLETGRDVAVDGLESLRVYRAHLQGRLQAIVADVTTSEGYSGDIRLLIAIDAEGTVLGVRVLEHRETPGLGDRIERSKSDWLRQFEGKTLDSPPAREWAPDRRNGSFDTVTSATITSTAVIDAIKRVLQGFSTRTDEWLANPDDAGSGEEND